MRRAQKTTPIPRYRRSLGESAERAKPTAKAPPFRVPSCRACDGRARPLLKRPRRPPLSRARRSEAGPERGRRCDCAGRAARADPAAAAAVGAAGSGTVRGIFYILSPFLEEQVAPAGNERQHQRGREMEGARGWEGGVKSVEAVTSTWRLRLVERCWLVDVAPCWARNEKLLPNATPRGCSSPRLVLLKQSANLGHACHACEAHLELTQAGQRTLPCVLSRQLKQKFCAHPTSNESNGEERPWTRSDERGKGNSNHRKNKNLGKFSAVVVLLACILAVKQTVEDQFDSPCGPTSRTTITSTSTSYATRVYSNTNTQNQPEPRRTEPF